MPSTEHSSPSHGAERHDIAAFRGNLRASLPLHPLEKALIWVAALNVCSLPWMLGGMRPWAQFIALGLSLLSFVLGLLPRHYTDHLVHGESYLLRPWRKLIRWPLWWIGFVFFAYVLIQALNPAYEFVQMPTSWGMVPIDHIEWLPTGMRTPFEMMNPWRQMMIWGAPFLLACALWIGFTRRKSIITLLTAIVANATLLAIVGIVARETGGKRKILWVFDSPVWYQFSSFIYKNHAGSFFALTLGLTLALSVYHHTTAHRKQHRSSPAPLMVFLAMIQAVAVLQSYSRAAILITGLFLVVFTLVAGGRLLWTGGFVAAPLLLGVFIIGLVGFGFMATKLVNSEKTLDSLQSLTDTNRTDHSVLSRQIAWQAGLEMSDEKPMTGWGAGGFRFLFPKYQMTRPEIVWRENKRGRTFMFWEHAHNDYLQLLIETGRIGAGVIGLGLITFLINFIRARGLSHPTALGLLGAGGISLAHAGADFPLQNPSILVTFATVALFALALPRLETRTR